MECFEEVIDLLNIGINNSVPKINYTKQTKWNEIHEISRRHNIEGIIYSVVRKKYIDLIDKSVLEQWKRETIMSSLAMNSLMNSTIYVFRILKKNNINFIGLKGIYLRSLYINPELRTMSDIDLLVRKCDLDIINTILVEEGYRSEGEYGHHIRYIAKNNHCIEIHWTLEKDILKKKSDVFFEDIFDKSVNYKFFDTNIKVLSDNELLIYLCRHMADHMYADGFGLRQLCDLVLLINKSYNKIDWDKFLKEITKLQLDKFTVTIFKLCNYLFDMKVVPELSDKFYVDEKDIKKLSFYIINSGVYGPNESIDKASNYIVRRTRGKNYLQMIKNILQLIFLRPKDLYNKYGYVKKSNLLIPIAWIHRGISFIKENVLQNKRNKSIFKIIKEKNEIFNILDL